MSNMPFEKPSEIRQTSSKALLTCPLCSQYFDDPRVLPCGHSFCRRCIQKNYDLKQAGSSIRIGRLMCPKCKTMIGIPLDGVNAFPVDAKINLIKDRVINELAENISKNIHLQNNSDTYSTRSDLTDLTDFPDTSSDDTYGSRRSNLSSQSRNTYTASDCGLDDVASDKTSGNGYQRNSSYPNMAKFAKYFTSNDENLEANAARYKPTIRAERHRVGYSSSFQHRRRRVVFEPAKAFDDADLGRTSRYSSAPHIGTRDFSSFSASRDEPSSSSGDIFRNVPQSSEDLSSPRSRFRNRPTMRDYKTDTKMSAKFTPSTDEFTDSTSSMPSLTKTQRDYASTNGTNDPNIIYTGLRNTSSEPKFNYSTSDTNAGLRDNTSSPDNGERTWRSPQDEENDRSVPAIGIPSHSSSNEKHSKYFSNLHEKTMRANLPTHRENIVTSTLHDEEECFTTSSANNNMKEASASNISEEPISRRRTTSRPTLRPHSYHSNGQTSYAFMETKAESDCSTSRTEYVDKEARPESDFSSKSKTEYSYKEQQPESDLSSCSRTEYSYKEARPETDFSKSRTEHAYKEAKPEPSYNFTERRPKSNLYETDSSTPKTGLFARPGHNFPKTPCEEYEEEYDKFKSEIFSTPQTARCKTETYANNYRDQPSKTKTREEISMTSKRNHLKTHGRYATEEIPAFNRESSFSSNMRHDNKMNGKDNDDAWQRGSTKQTRQRNNDSSVFENSFNNNFNNSSDNSFKSEQRRNFESEFSKKKNRRRRHTNYRLRNVVKYNEFDFESRDAFNEHIMNMSINRDHYDSIMSDFKNGIENDFNELSDPEEENLALIIKDVTDGKVISTETEAAEKMDAPKPHADDIVLDSQKLVDAEKMKEKEEDQERGRKMQEMIDTMRTKYLAADPPPTPVSVTLKTNCGEGVFPRWNFQKTDFGIPTSITITSKGCTIVADYGNSCLEYFDADGNYEHKIEGIKPFSVVADKHDKIIVGDRKGKAIRIFDEYGADVSQWEAGVFGWVCGIALLQNGNVVVYDRDRCRVGIFSSGGEKIHEFSSYGANDAQLCMADFLTVDGKDRVIISDSGNHCLKIFDTNGKFLARLGSRGSEDGFLLWPKGVCVDSMDNIIVADSQNNRVSMFSSSGQFVHHLLTTTPSPYNLCCGGSRHLLGVTHYSLTGFSQYDVYEF